MTPIDTDWINDNVMGILPSLGHRPQHRPGHRSLLKSAKNRLHSDGGSVWGAENSDRDAARTTATPPADRATGGPKRTSEPYGPAAKVAPDRLAAWR